MTKITEKELSTCARIIDRGLHYYNQLDPAKYDSFLGVPHRTPEWCFNLRSLAEITAGIELWFHSKENIEAISDAAFIDGVDLYRTLIIQAQIQGEALADIHAKNTEILKEKYFVYYPSEKVQIGHHRRNDHCYKNTTSITSKIIHQDEFSILGLGDIPSTEHRSLLVPLAEFWRLDFRNRLCITYSNFPELLNHYEETYQDIPFDYTKISFDKY